MKKLTFTIVLSLMYIISYAGDGGSFVLLKSSVSLPTGDFGANNLEKGCFVTPGVTYGVEGAWFFLDNIGIGADVKYGLFPVDASGLATAKVIEDPFMEDLTIRSDPYNILTTMGGVYYNLKLGNKIELQPTVMAGIMFGKTPFQLYEPSYFMAGPDYFKITSSRDSGFAISPGLSGIYKVNDCISIGVDADFTYSKLSFGFYSSGELYYQHRKISYIDLGLSLRINL